MKQHRPMRMTSLTIPGTPPSVNSYVRHTRDGRHYVTLEAKRFKRAVAEARLDQWQQRIIHGGAYQVEAVIYLGAGERRDVDNMAKVLLDALVDAGVMHSDAAVTDLILRKRRDRVNPRTEVSVMVTE